MQCAKCKSELAANAKFCPECGAAVPVETNIDVKEEVGGQRQYGDNITVGDISNSTGVGIGKHVKIALKQGVSAEEIVRAFAAISEKVHAMPDGPEKRMAETAVQGLEEEAAKGEQADEDKVRKWMNFLAETASDAFDVALAAFTNPIAGLGLVFKKVAERAKGEKVK